MALLAQNEQGDLNTNPGLEQPELVKERPFEVPAEQIVTGDYSEDEDYPEDYPDYYPTSVVEELKKTGAFTILEKREDTRGRLAIIYTVATFLMFIAGFIVAVLDAFWRQVSVIENLTTILPLLSGIFLGSLGFVLGYYFRGLEDEDKNN